MKRKLWYSWLLLISAAVASEAQKPYRLVSSPVITTGARVTLPGKFDTPLTLLSPTSFRKTGSAGIGVALATDPTLWTTRISNSAPYFNPPGYFWDILWGFPTTGYTAPGDLLFSVFPNTLQASAASTASNVAHVMLGQTGGPALISELGIGGVIADITGNGPEVGGSLAIYIFDGVDFADPVSDPNSPFLPSSAKIAQTRSGSPAAFLVRLPVPAAGDTNFGTYSLSLDPTGPQPDLRVKINDPQGRFGALVAKVDDAGNPNNPGPEYQWLGIIGLPSGANRVYQLQNGSYANLTLATIGGPAPDGQGFINQGAYAATPDGPAQTHPPLNYYLDVRGRNLNTTFPSRGHLKGSIRRRGLSLPGSGPESAPGFYALDFWRTTPTRTYVRTNYLYTQPSYGTDGALLDNFRVEGLPAGNYEIEIRQLPIRHFPNPADPNTFLDDIQRDTSVYPFADFLPARVPVTITNNITTTLSPVRLERFGDIDDGSGTGTRDGSVDVLDLAALIVAFDTAMGDPNFLPTADLGGGDLNFPDGSIDVLDLDLLIQVFDTGFVEIP